MHCVLTPVLFSLFPQFVNLLPGEATFHRFLVAGILLIGGAAFIPGYRIHRRASLFALIAAGMAMVLTVAWMGERLPELPEFLLSVTGSMLLVTAHLLNRSFCRSCKSCAESNHCSATDLS